MATSRRWFSVAFLCLSVAFSMSCSTFSSLGVGVSANGITPQNADRLKLVAEFPFFVDCTDYSIDSNRVAMYCGDVFLLYPELQSGSKRIRIEETSSMFSTALSPDGERMVTLIYEKSNLWNMKNSEKITEFPSSFGFATFSPDGKTIATTNPFDGDAIVRLWNASDGEAVGSLKTPDKSFGGGFHAAYSSNGKTLAIGSMSVAYLWDLVSPTPTAVFPMNSQVVWIGFSPGEKQLVATEIGNVHVWDIAAGKELDYLQIAHNGRVQGVSFSPDDSILVSWGEDRKAKSWNIASETEIVFDHLTDALVGDAGFDPGGKRFSIRSDNTISVWDAATGKNLLVSDLQTNCGDVEAVSPDWLLAVCRTKDNQLMVWDVLGGKAIKNLSGEEGMTLSTGPVRFSADGKFLAGVFSGFLEHEYSLRVYVFGVR